MTDLMRISLITHEESQCPSYVPGNNVCLIQLAVWVELNSYVIQESPTNHRITCTDVLL